MDRQHQRRRDVQRQGIPTPSHATPPSPPSCVTSQRTLSPVMSQRTPSHVVHQWSRAPSHVTYQGTPVPAQLTCQPTPPLPQVPLLSPPFSGGTNRREPLLQTLDSRTSAPARWPPLLVHPYPYQHPQQFVNARTSPFSSSHDPRMQQLFRGSFPHSAAHQPLQRSCPTRFPPPRVHDNCFVPFPQTPRPPLSYFKPPTQIQRHFVAPGSGVERQRLPTHVDSVTGASNFWNVYQDYGKQDPNHSYLANKLHGQQYSHMHREPPAAIAWPEVGGQQVGTTRLLGGMEESEKGGQGPPLCATRPQQGGEGSQQDGEGLPQDRKGLLQDGGLPQDRKCLPQEEGLPQDGEGLPRDGGSPSCAAGPPPGGQRSSPGAEPSVDYAAHYVSRHSCCSTTASQENLTSPAKQTSQGLPPTSAGQTSPEIQSESSESSSPTGAAAEAACPGYFQPVHVRASPLMMSTTDGLLDKPDGGLTRLERLSPAETEQVFKQWQEFIRDKYPELHSRPYCVPPVHFNRLSTKSHKVHGAKVELLRTDGDSNLKDDDAQRRLVSALYAMARQSNDIMFIMSSVTFDNFLKKPITLETPVPENVFKKRRNRKKQAALQITPQGQEFNPAEPQECQDHAKPDFRPCSDSEDKLSPLDNVKGGGKPSTQVAKQGKTVPASSLPPSPDNGKNKKQLDAVHKVRVIKKGKADKFFPAPSHLDSSYKRGDLDILVVHKQHGFVVMEIKAVGGKNGSMQQTLQDFEELVRRKLKKSAAQLDKEERVLRYVTSGRNYWQNGDPVELNDNEAVNLRKVIAFPNIRRACLRQTWETSPDDLQKRVQECLGCSATKDVLRYCLCEDDVPACCSSSSCDPHADLTAAISRWWDELINDGKVLRPMTDAGYEDVISRFCGKHSMVTVWSWGSPKAEVRTLAEAVYETGRRFCMLLLRPGQMDLLDSPEPRVFIHGPPGSGKTLLLVLKGVEWARQGRHVYILTGGNRSVSVSNVLYEQIVQTLKGSQAVVNVHKVFITLEADPEEEVSKMSLQSQGKPFGILVDECWKPVSSCQMVPILRSVLDILQRVLCLLGRIVMSSAQSSPDKQSEQVVSTETMSQNVIRELSLCDTGTGKAECKRTHSSLSEGSVSSDSSSQDFNGACKPVSKTKCGGKSRILFYQQSPENDTRHQLPSFLDVLSLVKRLKGSVGRMKSAQKLAKRDLPEEVDMLLGQILGVPLEDEISLLQTYLPRLFSPLRDSVRQDVLRIISHQMMSHLSGTIMVLSSVQAWITSVIFRHLVDCAARHPQCSAWAVGVWEGACPEGFALKTLTSIVRCPPSVQQVLAQVEQDASQTPTIRYTYLDCSTRQNPPLPSDGLDPTYLEHSAAACGETAGVEGIFQCYRCGQQLGKHLTTDLRICQSSRNKNGPMEGLRFNDVIISGNEARCRPDSPFVRGLCDQNVPVKVMIEVKGQEEVAQRLLTEDKVVITDTFYIHGLERKVVVYVPDVHTIGGEHRRVVVAEDDDLRNGPKDDKDDEEVVAGCPQNGRAVKESFYSCPPDMSFSLCRTSACTSAYQTTQGANIKLNGPSVHEGRSLAAMDPRLAAMGSANRQMLWYVASRTLSHAVIFHFGAKTESLQVTPK